MKGLALGIILLVACGGNQNSGAVEGEAEGTPLSVPSDAQAKYFVLECGGTADRPTIMTMRVGSSGTSYSVREYDCAARTVRYLATGDTREELAAAMPEANMAPIVDGAIADYVGRAACSR